MGTLARSWDLLSQSFALLKSEKELMWLPVISAIFSIFATVIICGCGVLFVLPAGPMPQDPASQRMLEQHLAPFIFLFYVATYSVTVYFNVALVSIAADRLAGGHATLSDGLQLAWDRKWSILQWALLAATLGTILQMIERRSSFLGRILVRGTAMIFRWPASLLRRFLLRRIWGRCRHSSIPRKFSKSVGEKRSPEASASVSFRCFWHC